MSLTRRRFNQSLLTLLGAPLLPAMLAAAPATELVEGRDWRALTPPQPVENPGRIEVLEFFSYGCPHCASFNPLIAPWAAKLPDDVDFQRVPVSFGRAAWTELARLYHALELSGALERLDQEVFDAVTHKRERLFTEEAMLDWVKARDVNPATFAELLRSFAVETRLARDETLARRYQISAVPTLIIAGRYVVLGGENGGLARWLEIADALIDQARASGATG